MAYNVTKRLEQKKNSILANFLKLCGTMQLHTVPQPSMLLIIKTSNQITVTWLSRNSRALGRASRKDRPYYTRQLMTLG